MCAIADGSEGTPSRSGPSIARMRMVAIVSACLVGVLAVYLYVRSLPSRSPPDLSDCTRLEVRYYRSALDHIVPIRELESILSLEDRAYIESLNTLTVTDKARISTFASHLSRGSYAGRQHGKLLYATPIGITCYSDAGRLTSFTMFICLIIVEDGGRFEYPEGVPSVEILEPPELRSFRRRFECAENLLWLRSAGSPARRNLARDLFHRDSQAYPPPGEWCDTVAAVWRKQSPVGEQDAARRLWSEQWMAGHFTCPCTRESVSVMPGEDLRLVPVDQNAPCSHYAMNPLCAPNSPPDMVLLFETGAGWNQHGGPELFVFDNHDPRGGCVLLNDGTVKFIRTEEELAGLRWR